MMTVAELRKQLAIMEKQLSAMFQDLPVGIGSNISYECEPLINIRLGFGVQENGGIRDMFENDPRNPDAVVLWID